MHVGALQMTVHLPSSSSRKDKRAIVRHILDTARQRFKVSASEVDHQDLWQLAGLGFTYVSPSPSRVSEVLDQVERFVWAQPDISVTGSTRSWLDPGS